MIPEQKPNQTSPWAALISPDSESSSGDDESEKKSPLAGLLGGGDSSGSASIPLPIEKPMEPIPGFQFMKPPKGFTPSSVPALPMPPIPKPSGPNLEKRHGLAFQKEAKQMAKEFQKEQM